MLGSFHNSQPRPALDYLNPPPASKAAAKQANKLDRVLNELIRREWAELPYAMMRLTASRMSWDHNRLYWRNETVHLGKAEVATFGIFGVLRGLAGRTVGMFRSPKNTGRARIGAE